MGFFPTGQGVAGITDENGIATTSDIVFDYIGDITINVTYSGTMDGIGVHYEPSEAIGTITQKL